MFQFRLPDPGEGLQEADITQWLVKEGDEVKVNDVLVEIETAKSLVELPSPVEGKISRLLAEVGQTVDVGTVIVEIDDGSGAGPAEEKEPEPEVKKAPEAPDEPSHKVNVTPTGKVLAKPLVRRLARDLGVDLFTVHPTGPHGSVSRADVELAAGIGKSEFYAPEPQRVVPGAPILDGRRVPIKGVRKATAANLRDSITRHIHVTEYNTIDVSATKELVTTLRARREFRDLHVSSLLIYAKAVCLAMRNHPEMNASWDAASGEVVYHDDVNLGIAAATPRGLLVPVIKAADKMTLVQLASALTHTIDISRSGRLQPADYTGGTFTITNVGVFGIDTGTPIINGSESAILAMGAIKRKPWVIGEGPTEQIVPRWVTTLALGFDHQLIDGEQGSQFLADVSEVLENPRLALLY